MQLPCDAQVNGMMARKGEWLVADEISGVLIYTDKDFRDVFEPVKETNNPWPTSPWSGVGIPYINTRNPLMDNKPYISCSSNGITKLN